MMCFVARYAVWAAVALCAGSAFAEGVLTPAAGSTGGSITVQEEDGSPAVSVWNYASTGCRRNFDCSLPLLLRGYIGH